MALKPVSDEDLLEIRRNLLGAVASIERVLDLKPQTVTCRRNLQAIYDALGRGGFGLEFHGHRAVITPPLDAEGKL